MRLAAGIAGLWLVWGCGQSSTLPTKPDEKSGPDQSWLTPAKIPLDADGDEAEADVSDTVTYPGGDRVDWKSVDLPDDGILTVQVTVHAARANSGANVLLLDSRYNVVSRMGSGIQSKLLKVKEGEKGRYYIMVYAPTKADAAAYDLTVHWKKAPPVVASGGVSLPPQFGPDVLPDPPELAGIPDAAAAPAPGTPGGPPGPGQPGGPGGPPLPGQPGGPPLAPVYVPPPVVQPPVVVTPVTPPVDETDKTKGPVVVQITDLSLTGSGTLLIISAGTNKGISPGWKGTILRGKTDKPLANGEVRVKKVFAASAQVETKLGIDAIGDNDRIKIAP